MIALNVLNYVSDLQQQDMKLVVYQDSSPERKGQLPSRQHNNYIYKSCPLVRTNRYPSAPLRTEEYIGREGGRGVMVMWKTVGDLMILHKLTVHTSAVVFTYVHVYKQPHILLRMQNVIIVIQACHTLIPRLPPPTTNKCVISFSRIHSDGRREPRDKVRHVRYKL